MKVKSEKSLLVRKVLADFPKIARSNKSLSKKIQEIYHEELTPTEIGAIKFKITKDIAKKDSKLTVSDIMFFIEMFKTTNPQKVIRAIDISKKVTKEDLEAMLKSINI